MFDKLNYWSKHSLCPIRPQTTNLQVSDASKSTFISLVVVYNVSTPLPALWPPLDRFKGHLLQVTFSYTTQFHRSSKLDL